MDANLVVDGRYVLSVVDVAWLLGVSKKEVLRLIKTGEIPHGKIHNLIIYVTDEDALEYWHKIHDGDKT